ncbi:class I SAM-dependent methyltransferase [Craterilacuibacter sinensis]|uniref:Methyltransferase domain-containing protein n=1 Tax=Craterilacuibacter sinensis TaxID=2686017 RepID=A0A845BRF1_9NEIS|nr:methyltransferase domain-containing protein [Craterilacuibacter sinensis]MXR37980.1 methyltransferase domain-containing protein [Craterilacuibacter sinensis]RQW26555.1 methyltransferase domain-containing protein [Rhodobacteraceae bacterium CH30]
MSTFSSWLDEGGLGQYLLQSEQAYFDAAVADAFGFRALQFGAPGHDFLRANRMPWRACIGDSGAVAVRCDAAQLPIDSRSLDLLLLPHTLDFTAHPHQVLREAERVLVPEGRLVLTGFNPFSAWGGRRLLQGRSTVPWSGNFLRLSRLKDWFELLGFELSDSVFMCYAPPLDRQDWLAHWQFMERVGHRCWPLVAGVYGLSAIKRQRGMRLIKPRWQARVPVANLAVLGDRRHAVDNPHDETL